MSNLTDVHLAIDPVHCRAICDEIGERLRYQFKRDTSDIPSHLRVLLDKLADLEFSPSIVPSLDEMSPAGAKDDVRNTKRPAAAGASRQPNFFNCF